VVVITSSEGFLVCWLFSPWLFVKYRQGNI